MSPRAAEPSIGESRWKALTWIKLLDEQNESGRLTSVSRIEH
jgi:hypothetical protein